MAPVNIQQRIGQKTANLAQPNGKTIKLETPHPIIQSNHIAMYTWHVRACGWLQHCIDFPCDHTGHETNLCCHQRSQAVPIGVAVAHGLNHRVRTATSTSFFKHLHTTGVDLSSTIQNVKKKKQVTYHSHILIYPSLTSQVYPLKLKLTPHLWS